MTTVRSLLAAALGAALCGPAAAQQPVGNTPFRPIPVRPGVALQPQLPGGGVQLPNVHYAVPQNPLFVPNNPAFMPPLFDQIVLWNPNPWGPSVIVNNPFAQNPFVFRPLANNPFVNNAFRPWGPAWGGNRVGFGAWPGQPNPFRPFAN